MNFDQVKVWWQSTAVRGGFLALVGLLLGVLFKGNIPVSAESLYDGITQLLTAVGIILGLVGRFTANSTLVSSTAAVTAARAKAAAAPKAA